ncbi:MAG: hypothetical protein JWL90_1387 [Chthoniobacteraceae bacterium]|nr:hypothetical protein [Chthoniobacteraceae bacterium]
MRHRFRAVIAGCVLLATRLTSLADDADGVKWTVRAEVQIASISTKQALSLLPELLDEARIEEGFKRLQAMISNEEALLLAWPIFWSHSGTGADSKSVEEIKYPDPDNIIPSIPRNFPMIPTSPLMAAVIPPSRVELYSQARFNLATVPLYYGILNIGPDIQIGPAVEAGGKVIHVEFTLRNRRLLRVHQFPRSRSYLGANFPESTETQFSSTLRVRNGQRVLAGSIFVPEPEPHVELLILQVSARSSETPGAGKN